MCFLDSFKLRLEEDNVSIAQWNSYQKDIWLRLAELGYVERNDPLTFYRFGKLFRDWYDHHGFIMTIQDVEDHLQDFSYSE